MQFLSRLVGIGSFLFASAACAAPVSPVSYDMINGGSGSFAYRDGSYSGGAGNPNTNYSTLTGGLGDLTDGVIATANWNVTPQPYVGWWDDFVPNPQVTFHFDRAYDFTRITAYVDDPNGTGGVSLPAKIGVAGAGEFTITDPTASAPIAFVMDVTGLTGNSVAMTFFHRNQWLMVSEVTFEGVAASAVPLPAALPLLGAGIVALGLMGRRGRSARAAG